MGCRCSELHLCMLLIHLNENEMTEEVVDIVSMFDLPQQIFPLVLSLKEEGNKFVRAGKFKQAVSSYTKAATCLVLGLPCCGNNYHPFRDLAIPINLNLAMCALKLSEFQMAKCLCDCVLEFDTLNVKALFRRAVTALNLGQLVAVESDLIIAMKIEPKNSELLEEWNKLVLLRDKQSIGTVEGLPSDSDMDLDEQNVLTSLRVRTLDFNPLHLPSKKKSKLNESIRATKIGTGVNEEGVDNLVGSNTNFQETATDPLNLDKGIEDGDSRPERSFSKTNLAEPKRFSNHSRPGSYLSISQPDYRKLASGRVINYGLSHSLGFMSVRVKKLGTDPSSIPSIQDFDLDSTSQPEDIESVGDNLEAIGHVQVEIVQEISSSCLIQSPPIIQTFSTTSNIISDKPDSLNSPNGNRSFSQLVRPHPFLSSISHSAFMHRKMRHAKRYTKNSIQLCPGMKRKGSSNTFISCYPLWKRRMSCNMFETGLTMGSSDQGLLNHLTKVTQGTTSTLASTQVTNLNFVPVDKLSSPGMHQELFPFI